jgi:alpha-beta hydrolase superfamily lysophospholipase
MNLRRVEFKNAGNFTLVGHFLPAHSSAAIILAYGFTSDKSALGRFEKLSESLNSSGYNVLTFDFSGCGESDGEISSVNQQVGDLKSAISFVQSKGIQKIGLYGHSLGTLICLKCASFEIRTMVLSGAMTDRMNYDWKEVYTKEQLEELAAKGFLTAIDRTGKERRIGRQILTDFEEVHQKDLLANVSCPVLIIHGNNPHDKEEMLLLERSRRAMLLLSSASRLEIIEGADHSLHSDFDKVIELSKAWFARHLPLS